MSLHRHPFETDPETTLGLGDLPGWEYSQEPEVWAHVARRCAARLDHTGAGAGEDRAAEVAALLCRMILTIDPASARTIALRVCHPAPALRARLVV